MLANLPPATRRLLVATAVVIVGVLIALLVRAASSEHRNANSAPGAEESTYPRPPATTSESIALPPGMNPPNATESEESVPRPNETTPAATTATTAADRSLNALASITDPQTWAQQFGIVWNSFTPVGGRPDQWVANVSNYSTSQCQDLISRDGGAPWAQAMMSQLTVTPIGTPTAQHLWTVDDASMWRVSTRISMQSVDPAYSGMNGTSATTWDFYLKRQDSGTYLLDSYANPTPQNENPRKYTPAR